MKIFWPVEKLSTEALLQGLENVVGAAFGIGFFIGVSILVLVNAGPLSAGQDVVAGIAYTVLLTIFLVLHFHVRRKIMPELKRRVASGGQ